MGDHNENNDLGVETKLLKSQKQQDVGLQDLNGIQGWLRLLAIGMVTSPISFILGIISSYKEVFNTGWFKVMNEIQSYHGASAVVFMYFELISLLFFLAASTYLAYEFFTKKVTFPMRFVTLILLNILFVIFDSIAADSIFDTTPETEESSVQIFSMILMAMIWIPYMFKSKRVKDTFIN